VNWLDWIIAVLVLTSVVASVIKGITREIVSLAALAAGILFGLWWYPEVAKYFEPHTASHGVAGFVAFLVILFAFLGLGWVAQKILGALVKAGGLGWADRLLGAAFGLARGVLASAALVLGIVSFLHSPGATRTVAQSKLSPAVLYCARGLAALAPKSLQESFERGFQKIREAWRDLPADSV